MKNRISRTRSTLYGAMILAVFLVVFGIRSLLSAHTQGVSAKMPMSAVVSLSASKTSFNETEDVILHVTITNPNNSPIKVLKWFTPLDGVDKSLFTVLHNGQTVPYIGRMIKRAAPTEQDYITLKAGESVTSDVNLSKYYDLSASDNYEVTYDVASLQLYMEKEIVQLNDGHLTSNTLSMFIKGRAAPVP